MPLRWKQRPEGSNWGDFGSDDQIGRLNLITSDKVMAALQEIKEGRTFSLSLPLDLPGGNWLDDQRFPPVLRPTRRPYGPNVNCHRVVEGMHATDIVNDDLVILHTHYSTHWDALCHIGQLFDVNADGRPEPVYYNGFKANTDVEGSTSIRDSGALEANMQNSTMRANKLGIENAADYGIQGRGVLIDLHYHFGPSRTVVGYEELMRVLDADRCDVESGDIVCLHTGFAQGLIDKQGSAEISDLMNLYPALNGRDPRLLRWVTDSSLSGLVADNPAVEVLPARSGGICCSALPLHEHCLFKLGIHLGELWHLTPLANYLREKGRSRFFLTAPPLRLTGAVGSPTMPIATV